MGTHKKGKGMGIQTYTRAAGTRKTPQHSPIPGRTDMVLNAAGGYVFEVDKWGRLDRFLILGSEGGTYYTDERSLTLDNTGAVRACLAEDGKRTVDVIVDVSDKGRAPKNDPAIFALGLALKTGDEATRKYAQENISKVVRIGTHLFQLAEVVESLGGWGRGTRATFARWYAEKGKESLAYQLVKYRQRNGWTHRDVLRLAHPTPNALLGWAAGKATVDDVPIIEGFEKAQKAGSAKESAALIREYKLPREAILTEHLSDVAVQDALLVDMPVHAMVRNLGNMTKSGLLVPGSDATRRVITYLEDVARLRKARLHPMAVLIAQRTYARGQGLRGSGTWAPVPKIIDALDEAFYACFANVEPTNRKIVIGIDTSGSMGAGWGNGMSSGLTTYEAATAMALVTLATEPNSMAMGFDSHAHDLALSGKQRLNDALEYMRNQFRGGMTDCSVPYKWAAVRFPGAEDFITITDNESWAGDIHPTQALVDWRRFSKGDPQAKAVVMAMTATRNSIADPHDAGQLNVVGFDATVPAIIGDFISGATAHVASNDR